MVERLVEKIIKKLVDTNSISKDDIAIYRYGYIVLFEVLINVVIATLIGVISSDWLLIILFLGIYIPLRSFCGGWHADKIWKCTIYSNLIILIMIIINEYIGEITNYNILIITFTICLMLIINLAPMGTKYKPISMEERDKYKKIIRVMLISYLLVFVFCILLKWDKMIYVSTFSCLTQAIMLILEKVSRIHEGCVEE